MGMGWTRWIEVFPGCWRNMAEYWKVRLLGDFPGHDTLMIHINSALRPRPV